MCYTAEALLKRQIRQARRKGEATDIINTLIDDYNRQAGQGDLLPRLYHQVSGFAHPLLPVIALPETGAPLSPMQWGLIPHWCRDSATAKVHFATYDPKQQEFLNFVLEQYVRSGVHELDDQKLPQLLDLRYKSVADAKAQLGPIPSIRNTFIGFQKWLYGEVG